MKTESLISVVAPLEEDTPQAVEAFVEETVAVLRDLVSHYEIILVDDGAPDDTVARVHTMLERYDFVRFLRLSRHFGEETAIAAGLDVAIGDYVIVMLPNMDPPALIPEFFERARQDGHRLRRAPASQDRAALVSRRRSCLLLVHQLGREGRNTRRTPRSSAA